MGTLRIPVVTGVWLPCLHKFDSWENHSQFKQVNNKKKKGNKQTNIQMYQERERSDLHQKMKKIVCKNK